MARVAQPNDLKWFRVIGMMALYSSTTSALGAFFRSNEKTAMHRRPNKHMSHVLLLMLFGVAKIFGERFTSIFSSPKSSPFSVSRFGFRRLNFLAPLSLICVLFFSVLFLPHLVSGRNFFLMFGGVFFSLFQNPLTVFVVLLSVVFFLNYRVFERHEEKIITWPRTS